MKALFLDIDGCMNSTDSVVARLGPTAHDQIVQDFARELGGAPDKIGHFVLHGLSHTDPVSVELLNKLIREVPDLILVLSSSHRLYFFDVDMPYGSERHVHILKEYLRVMGIKVTDRFDITPNLHKKRGDEVQAWIEENEEVDEYVIIDDSGDFYKSQPLVLCSADQGFTFKEYSTALRMLGGVQSLIIT